MCENQSAGEQTVVPCTPSAQFCQHMRCTSLEFLISPQGYLPHHSACFSKLYPLLYYHVSESHKSQSALAFIIAISQLIGGVRELYRSRFSLGMREKFPRDKCTAFCHAVHVKAQTLALGLALGQTNQKLNPNT